MTCPIDWDLIAINNDALEPVELISRLIAGGMSVEQIARQFGISTRPVYCFMASNGIKPPNRQGRPRRGCRGEILKR